MNTLEHRVEVLERSARRWRAVAVVALLVVAGGVGVAAAPTEGPATRPTGQPLPLIGKSLGAAPKDLAPAVYPGSDVARLQRIMGADFNAPTDWFAPGVGGSSVALAKEEGGRVVWVRLFYKNATAAKGKALRSQVEKVAKPAKDGESKALTIPAGPEGVPVHVTFGGIDNPEDQKQPRTVVVTFEVDRIEWYLANHKVEAPVAAAMRKGELVKGMKVDEARLALGNPETERVDSDGGGSFEWVTYSYGFGRMSITGDVIQPATATPRKMVRAEAKKGVIVGFSVTEYRGD